VKQNVFANATNPNIINSDTLSHLSQGAFFGLTEHSSNKPAVTRLRFFGVKKWQIKG